MKNGIVYNSNKIYLKLLLPFIFCCGTFFLGIAAYTRTLPVNGTAYLSDSSCSAMNKNTKSGIGLSCSLTGRIHRSILNDNYIIESNHKIFRISSKDVVSVDFY